MQHDRPARDSCNNNNNNRRRVESWELDYDSGEYYQDLVRNRREMMQGPDSYTNSVYSHGNNNHNHKNIHNHNDNDYI